MVRQNGRQTIGEWWDAKLAGKSTLCGRCGKRCVDNIPPSYRTKDECNCEEKAMMNLYATKEAIQKLNEKGVDFETARTMLVNQHGMTFGEASRQIEAAEELAGVRLGGDRAAGKTPPAVIGEYSSHMLASDSEGNAVMVPADDILDEMIEGATMEEAQAKANERARTGLDDGPSLHEAPKMTQAELQAFLPRCMVCGDPIPDRRARARKETCGKTACGVTLKQWRRAVLESRKCPACYKPSTPEEREDYKQWRRERGMLHRRAGNPHGKKPKTSHELLEQGAPLLREVRAMLKEGDFPGGESDWSKQFASHLAEVEKLIADKSAT
jgi:hypothetical protein